MRESEPFLFEPLRDEIIQRNPFREQVFQIIPAGAQRILDFGCHEGELLLRLQRDKQCGQLYGIDIDPALSVPLAKLLDGFWNCNLGAPQVNLPEDYVGFFRYIIMHDVVEHLYDPWYVCAKLWRYLAADGRLIVVTPNVQNWQLVLQIVSGYFPYGVPGGIMNEDHIRWFTFQGLQEMLALSGYEPEYIQLIFPPGTEAVEKNLPAGECVVALPPPALHTTSAINFQVQFPDAGQAQRQYQLFLANKLMAVCRRANAAVDPEPLRPGMLRGRRARYRQQQISGGQSHGAGQ